MLFSSFGVIRYNLMAGQLDSEIAWWLNGLKVMPHLMRHPYGFSGQGMDSRVKHGNDGTIQAGRAQGLAPQTVQRFNRSTIFQAFGLSSLVARSINDVSELFYTFQNPGTRAKENVVVEIVENGSVFYCSDMFPSRS